MAHCTEFSCCTFVTCIHQLLLGRGGTFKIVILLCSQHREDIHLPISISVWSCGKALPRGVNFLPRRDVIFTYIRISVCSCGKALPRGVSSSHIEISFTYRLVSVFGDVVERLFQEVLVTPHRDISFTYRLELVFGVVGRLFQEV